VGKAAAGMIGLPSAHRPQLSSLHRLQLRLAIDHSAKKAPYEQATWATAADSLSHHHRNRQLFFSRLQICNAS
jgi:hypothetical protein